MLQNSQALQAGDKLIVLKPKVPATGVKREAEDTVPPPSAKHPKGQSKGGAKGNDRVNKRK